MRKILCLTTEGQESGTRRDGDNMVRPAMVHVVVDIGVDHMGIPTMEIITRQGVVELTAGVMADNGKTSETLLL